MCGESNVCAHVYIPIILKDETTYETYMYKLYYFSFTSTLYSRITLLAVGASRRGQAASYVPCLESML